MNDNRPHPGLLISFEGPEGSGKSTLIAALSEILTERGVAPLLVREPGGTKTGERVRDILLDADLDELRPETELLLMVASRAQLVGEKIDPALRAGRIVLCDRYADASVAYQGGGRQLGREIVDTFNTFAIGRTLPDLVVLCLLPPEIGRRRMADRQKDRLERESPEFHQRVYRTYLEMAESGDPRYVVVDAASSPREMLNQTLGYLRSLEHELLKSL